MLATDSTKVLVSCITGSIKYFPVIIGIKLIDIFGHTEISIHLIN